MELKRIAIKKALTLKKHIIYFGLYIMPNIRKLKLP